MKLKPLSPKLDIIFKKIFSENKDLLKSLLSAMLDIPIEQMGEVLVLNGELMPNDIDGKVSRLDLSAEINQVKVNIEIQIKQQNDYADRSLYYWAKMYVSDLKSGSSYAKLKKTISINILDFNLLKTDSCHSKVEAIIKETGEKFSDKFEMHFFELRKLSEEPKIDRKLKLWLRFLKAEREEDFVMLEREKDVDINKAIDVVHDMSADEKIRQEAWTREKTLNDYYSDMCNAREEGREEGVEIGREEGREEERMNIIKNLKAMGLSQKDIERAVNGLNV